MPLLHPAILLACISESHHYPGPWVVHLTLRVDGLYSPRIDHILVSRGFRAEGFKVGRDGGSDHRAISVILSLFEEML